MVSRTKISMYHKTRPTPLRQERQVQFGKCNKREGQVFREVQNYKSNFKGNVLGDGGKLHHRSSIKVGFP